MMSARRRFGAAGAIALLAGLAGLEFHRVFGWGPITGRVLAAAAIALAIRLAAAWWKPDLSLAVTGGASAVALVLAVPVLTAGSAPSPEALHFAFDGLLNGWSRILSSPLPVAAHGDLLVLPVVLTWVATLCATEIALRTRRPALAVVVPAAAFGFALVFGIGGPGSRIGSAAMFCTVAAAYCLMARSSAVVAGGEGGWRRAPSHRLMVGALIGVACVAGAAVLGPVLPGVTSRAPYDPRRSQQPPHQELSAIDPMSLIAGWAQNPEPVLFTVTAAAPKAWRLAVVDRYNPETGWSSGDTFKPIGTTIAVSPVPGRFSALTEQVTVGALPGVWLPFAGQPRRLSEGGALLDRTGNVVADPAGVGDGLRYTVVADVPVVPPDCTVAPASPLGPADIASSVPSELAALARRVTAGATSACARATYLADYLRSTAFSFSKDAPSGSSLARIAALISAKPGEAVGTSEQFATAFALMARSVGLPTRIVVGFHAGESVGGAYRVHAGDGFAWAEIHFQGVGWVAFDPTPVPGGQPVPPEIKEEQAAKQKSLDAGGGSPATVPPTEGPASVPHRPPTGTSPFVVGLAVVAILVALTGALGGLVALTRRRRRRRREGAADPRVRLVGAWRQCLDALRSVGLGPVESDSATECADRASALGAESSRELAVLAAMVNQSLFSSLPPDSGAVDQAWTFADRVEARVAERRTASDKVRHALDPRLLVNA